MWHAAIEYLKLMLYVQLALTHDPQFTTTVMPSAEDSRLSEVVCIYMQEGLHVFGHLK